MALNGTMVKIDTVTVTAAGGQTAIEFTNIPQTYTDLLVKFSLRSARAGTWRDGMKISFNGSTSNFSYRMLEVTGGGTPGSYSASDGMVGNIPAATATASTFGSFELYVPNYTSSTNKSYSGDSTQPNNDGTNQTLNMVAGLWSNTAAITSLKITADNGNLVQYSTATLYGISRTTAQIKATGGMVYEDDSYVYHLFLSSGTFTPTQNLSCDYVVVAGGGGGAAGGSGAGGFKTSIGGSPLSLTANSSNTVTIGAGGTGATVSYNGSSGRTAGSNSVFASITATGGGPGGGYSGEVSGGGTIAALGGGSGGGASYSSGTSGYGLGTSGEGNNGGQDGFDGTPYSAAGGGGAGAVGQNNQSSSVAGNGGAGTYNAITNAVKVGELSGGNYYLAGGGGGGIYGGAGSGTAGTGGLGGGGAGSNGATATTTGVNGTANTGGGCGGSSYNAAGRQGGSGVVIVRYAK
jgi:hypothetical protein